MRLTEKSKLALPFATPNSRGDSTWLRRILGLGVIRLYFPEHEVHDTFLDHRYNMTVFFQDLVNQDPIPTQFQADINRLMPYATTVHLYVGAEMQDTPTHYVSLTREKPGDLFRIRHNKVRTVSTQHNSRNGCLMYWPMYSIPPLPDTAAPIYPSLSRLFSGGKVLTAFAIEVQSDYEVRRSLSHAYLIAEWFNSVHDRFHTWHNPGRVSLVPHTDDADGYITPFGFEIVKIRPSATPTHHQSRAIIEANINATVSNMGTPFHRLAAPTLKNPRILTLPSYPIIRELLWSQTLPFIGILNPDTRKANFYGTHYCPPDDEDHPNGQFQIALYAENRSERYCNSLPVFFVRQFARGIRWIPNYALLYLFKGLLLDPTPNEDMYTFRREVLDRTLIDCLMSRDWVQYFKSCNVDLSIEEEATIRDRSTLTPTT